MSKLGNLEKQVGQQFNISTANTSAQVLLTAQEQSNISLVKNSLIVTSPYGESATDTEGADLGVHELLITDYEGKAARLTYTMAEGNGLSFDEKAQTLGISIDNVTIKSNLDNLSVNNINASYMDGSSPNTLYVDAYSLIDNNTIKAKRTIVSERPVTQMSVNTSALTYATANSAGVIKLSDQLSITQKGQVQIVADKLSKISATYYGVGKIDDVTITTNTLADKVNDNAVLRVNYDYNTDYNTHNSTKNYNEYIQGTDGYYADTAYFNETGQYIDASSSGDTNTWVDAIDDTVITYNTLGINQNNKLCVLTHNLSHATKNYAGVVKVDDKTIKIDNNGKINVQTTYLTSGTPYFRGVVKLDGTSIINRTNGTIGVKNYDALVTMINKLSEDNIALNDEITAMKNDIISLRAIINNQHVFTLFSTALNSETTTITNTHIGATVRTWNAPAVGDGYSYKFKASSPWYWVWKSNSNAHLLYIRVKGNNETSGGHQIPSKEKCDIYSTGNDYCGTMQFVFNLVSNKTAYPVVNTGEIQIYNDADNTCIATFSVSITQMSNDAYADTNTNFYNTYFRVELMSNGNTYNGGDFITAKNFDFTNAPIEWGSYMPSTSKILGENDLIDKNGAEYFVENRATITSEISVKTLSDRDIYINKIESYPVNPNNLKEIDENNKTTLFDIGDSSHKQYVTAWAAYNGLNASSAVKDSYGAKNVPIKLNSSGKYDEDVLKTNTRYVIKLKENN